MKKDYVGIDLGSSLTTIYSSSVSRTVFSEPTAVLLDSLTKECKEIGFLANKIKDRNPYNLEIINPVKNGLIADDDAVYMLLSQVFEKISLERRNRNLVIIFTAPSECSKVQRKVLADLGKKLGAREIYIESQAKIAAIGANEDVYSPSATLVCHIGSGISDIAVLTMGEVVSAASAYVAGDRFDEAIRRYMIQKQHLSISLSNAEYIKKRIGNINDMSENRLVEIKGRDTITSLPSTSIVSSAELRNILLPLVDYIGLRVSDVISSITPELASDLLKNGMILTGGSAALGGLKDYFRTTLNMPVKLAENNDDTIAEGFRRYIEKLEETSK